ncbi:hypothetical protein EVB78_079 [Rhizobium phage RHph_N1_15]|nr:hypothetical protein EVB77_078 [Rhizobium phage RHph_N1_10]QIG69281.1 hypothetical protein EVB78_079 [Rhizobium phage RHph_N1_15]QIG75141.1 hypothetical protein EVC15_079 [Rhizobium phage RHph_N2_6]
MQNQQQAITKSHLNSIQEIPFDLAWVEGEKLVDGVRTDKEGVTIFTGTHPEHGNIHILIPTVGQGLLLFPFVVQDF